MLPRPRVNEVLRFQYSHSSCGLCSSSMKPHRFCALPAAWSHITVAAQHAGDRHWMLLTHSLYPLRVGGLGSRPYPELTAPPGDSSDIHLYYTLSFYSLSTLLTGNVVRLYTAVMNCTICDKQIPVPRLDAQPNAITCSRDCSSLHAKKLRRQGARRQRLQKKEARLGISGDYGKS